MYLATAQIHCDTKKQGDAKSLAFLRLPSRIGPIQLASHSSPMMSRKSVAGEEIVSFQ
jgi:hypothetical protein